ncbi:sugar transporter [Antarcticimicrobium sediminis]|uniref:sugar transporter n=1 Tax=Antarcticimicrobium sediminis TaxID=2546227 RepID=UPI001FE1598E|nr:sugar transporter [Antarcticimicrobium sediminis]
MTDKTSLADPSVGTGPSSELDTPVEATALTRPRPGRNGGPKGGKRKRPPEPAPVAVRPIAQPARLKKRHWGLLASFVLMVLVPLVATAFYLWTVASDQYMSTTGFTVRSQESGGATELLGGLAQFAGGTIASDSDILYEFIQSQEMVEAVDAKLDLRAHYTGPWPGDWAFALWPDASVEDLVWYWQRIVGISYDGGTGLIEVQAMGFVPEVARAVASAILSESQDRINALNNQAREDAMRYARDDLDQAIARLKSAREALTRFRTRTRIVDPAADIQGRMGVMNNLQQQLAEALIDYDLLRGTTSDSDPRLTKAQQRIDVIRDRIRIERQTFTSDNTDTGAVGEDYPTLIAEFESLNVDLQYAEETYRAALTALQVARDDAARQSRYLATYIKPTLAQEAEYPQRGILTGLAGLFLLLLWSICALIYYSIRDRS